MARRPSSIRASIFTEYALLSAGDVLRVFARSGAAGAIDVAVRITIAREE